MSTTGVPEYASVDGLRLRLDGGVLRATLDRPDKRNAIDDTMLHALIDTLEVCGNDERVRVMVLDGNGEHFCTGADFVARNTAAHDVKPRAGSIQRRLPMQAHRLIPLLCSVQVPVVCKVRGWAAGIGMQIAMAADFTIATDDARFWEPFSERGFTPDSGATWLLPRLVGMTRARELLLLGRALDGREAQEWGIIHRAVEPAALDVSVDAVVERLAAGPTVALGLTKWLLHEGAQASLEQHLANEAFALELSSRSEDFREGFGAFREKRTPDFRGR
jgi:2-(1,2-epoxy-1,2-dihydrophenyl)acetyl-CoA isomerase